MGFAALDSMKDALLVNSVSPLERIVLLDMAVAVDDNLPVYSWGHERLARALGKEPGTKAAKSSVERLLSSLRARGLIVQLASAHRGRRAVYGLAVLDVNGPRSERGPLGGDAQVNGPRSGTQWAPVPGPNGPRSDRGPSTYISTSNSTGNTAVGGGALSDAQRKNVTDAFEAISDKTSEVNVFQFLSQELDYLATIPSDISRSRIGDWSGLRKRAWATQDGGEDLVEDKRLRDLLLAHGFDCWEGVDA